jgi:chitodextrinase
MQSDFLVVTAYISCHTDSLHRRAASSMQSARKRRQGIGLKLSMRKVPGTCSRANGFGLLAILLGTLGVVHAASDTQAPTAPSGVTATSASGSEITLQWSQSSDNVGVTGYAVERCTGSACTHFTQIALQAATSFSQTGLAPGSQFRYRVRARDAASNWSAYSAIVSVSTPAASDTDAPTAPPELSIFAQSRKEIDLAWGVSSDNVASSTDCE